MKKLYRCTKCRELKIREEFNGDRASHRGFSYLCRSCSSAKNKIYRTKNRERIEEYRQTDRYKRTHLLSSFNYIKNNPEKQQARILAHKYTKRKKYCEECLTSKGILHRHHPNYSKPLDIITLCQPCHELKHHTYG